MSVITSGHPSISALAAFALGKLDAPAAETVHNHLAGCPECRTVVETTPGDTLMGLLKKAAKPGDTPSLTASIFKGTLPVPNPEFDVAELPAELRDHPRYRIIRKLGEGGMGAVYQAEHRMMERVVAIKVIAPDLVNSPEAIERFQREVRAAAKLEHANIVRAYDADQAGGTMLLAMEFVKGRTLAEVIAAKGPLPVGYACQCVRQAALGLQHAADHQMVHRDIKPQNLMLTEKGVVKILDFGLAKLVSERATRPGLTGLDMVMGTPEYMAPEQARDTASADIRADIYALGCTLFYLLTGRPPFTGESAIEIVTKQWTDAPPRVTDLRPEVPPELADLIGRMLAKKPDERPQTPREVAEALKAFTKAGNQPASRALPAVQAPFADMVAGPISLRIARPTSKRPRWLLSTAVAAGIALATIIAATVIWWKTPAGYVRLEVTPDDAEVLVDDNVLHVKPYEIRVDAKEHKLVVRKDGFDAKSEKVTLTDRAGRTIRIELTRLQEVPKADQMKAEPPKAELDPRKAGPAPTITDPPKQNPAPLKAGPMPPTPVPPSKPADETSKPADPAGRTPEVSVPAAAAGNKDVPLKNTRWLGSKTNEPYPGNPNVSHNSVKLEITEQKGSAISGLITILGNKKNDPLREYPFQGDLTRGQIRFQAKGTGPFNQTFTGTVTGREMLLKVQGTTSDGHNITGTARLDMQ